LKLAKILPKKKGPPWKKKKKKKPPRKEKNVMPTFQKAKPKRGFHQTTKFDQTQSSKGLKKKKGSQKGEISPPKLTP